MKTRKNKTTKQIWIKWLDLLWGMVIHNLDDKCIWCGKHKVLGKLDAHHLHGRAIGIRHELDNGVLLCFRCHRFRIHTEHEELRTIVVLKLGEKRYLELYKLSKTPMKYINYEEIESILISQLELLKITIPSKPKKLIN